MNSLSFKELCCLFCCPPCPSTIASKLAFLPPEPTYSFITSSEDPNKLKINLFDRAEWQFTHKELDFIEVFTVTTNRNNKIACMFVKTSPDDKHTILFSHGNAVDLGQMSSFFIGLSSRISCNILGFDYSGYGVSTGKPSEKNTYSDIDSVFQILLSKYKISLDHIILYGQSIGTVPTIDLASRKKVGAVILHSPLMSGLRVVFPQSKRACCLDVFTSIDKVPNINSPVLVIHGTEDEVIDISHGLAIFEKCPLTLDPLWVEGAGHNDVELYSQYLERLRKLINVELNH